MKAPEIERPFALDRILMVAAIVALLITNALSITNATIHESMFKALSLVTSVALLENSIIYKQAKLEVENKKLLKQNQDLRNKIVSYKTSASRAKTIGKRIAKRTATNVTTNLASLVKKATPYIGVALVVLDTKNDVEYGCQTIRDMNELLQSLEAEAIVNQESQICGIQVPDLNKVLEGIKEDIGGTVYHAKENTTENARNIYEAIGGTINEILN
jgi:hypothetical protein